MRRHHRRPLYQNQRSDMGKQTPLLPYYILEGNKKRRRGTCRAESQCRLSYNPARRANEVLSRGPHSSQLSAGKLATPSSLPPPISQNYSFLIIIYYMKVVYLFFEVKGLK